MIQAIKKTDRVTLGLWILAATGLLALLSPWLCPYDPNEIDVTRRLLPPGTAHWLGTDDLGRDAFSRMLYGSRISLGVGVAAAGLSCAVGIILGAISGYFGGWVDTFMMRCVDVLLCIPGLYLVIMLIVLLGPSIWNVVIVIALTGWTGMARLIRAEVLSLKSREFILSARAVGASDVRLIFKHLLPNAMTPVYVAVTFDFAGAIMMESGLSFLGLGVQAPTPSWGNMLTAGREYMMQAWWLIFFPGLAIFAAMLLINYLGEGLRSRARAGAGS